MFLVNGQTGLHTKERRTIRFWCNGDQKVDASAVASQFFQDLVLPDQFPLGIYHLFIIINNPRGAINYYTKPLTNYIFIFRLCWFRKKITDFNAQRLQMCVKTRN